MLFRSQYQNNAAGTNYHAVVSVQNVGEKTYDNRKLSATTYVNGRDASCVLRTFNGHSFIPTQHTGIQKITGGGTKNYFWYAKSTVSIWYRKDIIRKGDVVQLDVFDRDSGQIISRDIWPHTGKNTEKWLRLFFSHPGA